MADTVNILIVDDDLVDVKAVRRGLQSARVANPIFTAKNGQEALDMLRGVNSQAKLPRPFLILLDLNMPSMNGGEFLEAIREDEDLHDSVVFVLTTSKAEEDRTAAYQKNVAGYIVKDCAGQDFVNLTNMLECYWKIVLLP